MFVLQKVSATGTRTPVSCVKGKYANHLHHGGHRSATGSRTPVSCVRGKYDNHLHHSGEFINCVSDYCTIQEVVRDNILVVGIEPTTLGLLDPRSNQLSYTS